MRHILSRLLLVPLLVAGLYIFAAFAQKPAYISSGSSESQISYDGLTLATLSEGTVATSEFVQKSAREREAKVLEFAFKNTRGSFALNPGRASTITLVSRHKEGKPFYPADAIARFDIVYRDTQNNLYQSVSASRWTSPKMIKSWPPQKWAFVLDSAVKYVHKGNSIVLESSRAELTIKQTK